MDDKFKIPMNEEKFVETMNKKLKRVTMRSALSVVLAASMLAPMAAPMQVFAEGPQGGVVQPADKKWQGIELPAEVALPARPLNEGVSKKEIEEAIKNAIKDKNKNINISEISINMIESNDEESKNEKDLTYFNRKFTKDNGVYRKSQYWTFNGATVTFNNNTSEPIPVKFLSYAMPFWQANDQKQILDKNVSINNQQKIKVADPNNYTLTQEQQNAIKKAFIAINQKTNNQFPIQEKDLTVDDKGNLSFKDAFGKEIKIPSHQNVSVFPIFDEVILFSKLKDDKTGWTTSQTYTKTYKLRDGVKLSKFSVIQKPQNQDNKGLTVDDGVLPFEGKMFGMVVKYDKQKNEITITGTMNFDKKLQAGAFNKMVKTVVDGDNNYYRDVSNRIAFRTIGVEEPETLYRDVDDETQKVTKDNLEGQLKVKGVGTTGDDGDQNKKKEEIKNAVTKELTDTEFNKVKHDTKAFYTAQGKLKYGEGEGAPESAPIDLKVRYYTKKFDVIANNPNKLTEDEKAELKKAAATANNVPENDVTVSDDGTVKVKFNDGKKDKVIDLGKEHVLVPKYTDQTVTPGDKKESTISAKKGDKDATFPKGTTFEKPLDAPKGIEVGNDGKVTFTVPEDFDLEGKDSKDVEGVVIVKLPGQTYATRVPYKFTVEKKASIKVKYVLQDVNQNYDNPTEIDQKFRAEEAEKYPGTVTGEKGTTALAYFGVKGKPAPKFTGYKFVKPVAYKQSGEYTVKGDQTLLVVYEKQDEIKVADPAKNGKDKPEGYVALTFKDVEGAKVGGDDKDKVIYVNPKAGVKFSNEGSKLVGKKADGTAQEVAVPVVTADEGYDVVNHKPSENETTTWAYDNYDEIVDKATKADKEITKDITFTAQVKEEDTANNTPTYKDTTAKPGVETTVPAPTYTDKTGASKDKAPEGTKYAYNGTAPDGVSVDKDTGEIKVTPKKNAKIGDKIEIPVKVTYPDGTTDEVDVTVTIGEKPKTDAEKNEPKGLDINVKVGETPEAKNAIKDADKLPKGTTFAFKEPVDTTIAGEKPATVVVTYPDETKDEVSIKVIVTEKAKPEAPVEIKAPEKIEVKDPENLTKEEKDKIIENIKKNNPNLPNGAVIDVTDNGKVTIKVTIKDKDKVLQEFEPKDIVIKKVEKIKPIENPVDPNWDDYLVNNEPKTPTHPVFARVPEKKVVDTKETKPVESNIYLEKLYMNGVGDNNFAGQKSLTRAEAAQILANALKSDGYNKTAEVSYKDIDAKAWYADAIKTVTAAGVFEGYEDGTFKPEKEITKAEWIATLVRFQKLEKVEGNTLKLEKHWALGDVEAALKAGWLGIYTDGTEKLDLDAPIKRQEVAYVTNRAFNKLVDKDYLRNNEDKLVHFKDVDKNSVYFEEILAAANNLYRNTEERKEGKYLGYKVNEVVSEGINADNAKVINFQNIPR